MHGYSIWPFVIMTVMIGQRISELVISARHAPRVRALGGVEYGAGHFPFIVAAHVFFFLHFLFEIAHHGARPGPLWPLWLAVWIFAQVLRYSAMRSLGDRWNVRIWVVPGMAPVNTGPYRWLSHPNYLAVILEFVAAPMMFGAWRTAIIASLANAPVLAVRIRCENDALQRAAVASSR